MSPEEAEDFIIYINRLAEHVDGLALEVAELEVGGVPGPMTGYLCQARGALNLSAAALTEFVQFKRSQPPAAEGHGPAVGRYAAQAASDGDSGVDGDGLAAASEHGGPLPLAKPDSGDNQER